MISIGTDLKEAISAFNITAVSFITLDFPTSALGPVYMTEAPRDITIGGRLFESSDSLVGLSPPQTQNSVDRDTYSIQLADNGAAFRDRFEVARTGVPIIVQLGFINVETGVLITELLNVYKGQSAAVTWRPDRGGYITEVSFTGQLTQLESTATILTTPLSQQQVVIEYNGAQPWVSTVEYGPVNDTRTNQVSRDGNLYRTTTVTAGDDPITAGGPWTRVIDTSMRFVQDSTTDDALRWGRKG